MVQAMASYLMLAGPRRLGVALLLCFTGLLRVGDLIKLRLHELNCIKDDWAVLTLPDSKGAKRGQARVRRHSRRGDRSHT